MNKPNLPASAGPEGWTRPEPSRVRPNRGVGGYWRSADRVVNGKTVHGVPLNTREDMAVAAVKMAYKIADGYAERGLRIARNLRDTGKRQGVEPVDALDASERVIGKALMTGLEWVEGAAGAESHPLRRLLAAEYRMVGSLFGLSPAETASQARKRDEAAAGSPAPPQAAPTRESAPAPATQPALRIRNTAPREKRRPVRSSRLVLPGGALHSRSLTLHFLPSAADATAVGVTAELSWDPSGAASLEVDTLVTHQHGEWVAGVYDTDGHQLGTLFIEL